MLGEGKQNVYLMQINRNGLYNKVWEETLHTRSESSREGRVI